MTTDAGSFRDPSSRVFDVDGEVLRALDETAAADWDALRASRFFDRLVADGRVVGTREVPLDRLGEHAETSSEWRRLLLHDRVPFVSYPYEWTFGMLRDAAELHVEILCEALAEGMTMKDGYAYNVQWQGAKPVFIDIPSLARGDGGPWAGYRQFCQTFLNPLLLQAHKGVPFHQWLRGSVEGIRSQDLRRLMSRRDLLRRGVLKHVAVQSAMGSRVKRSSTAVGEDLRRAGFDAEVTKATANGLLKLVRRLDRSARPSHWARYRDECSYSDDDRAAKEAFVADAAREAPVTLAYDLGTNDGAYARALASHAEYVVAVDSDESVVDALYGALRRDGVRNVLPLVIDLLDPSPGMGWRGIERRSFGDRGKPDLVLALALLHHLVIAGNVPLGEAVRWLRSFGSRVVVEFVAPEDPMAQTLLANKPSGMHDDYRLDEFERHVATCFDVRGRRPLPSGTRVLYLVEPRG